MSWKRFELCSIWNGIHFCRHNTSPLHQHISHTHNLFTVCRTILWTDKVKHPTVRSTHNILLLLSPCQQATMAAITISVLVAGLTMLSKLSLIHLSSPSLAMESWKSYLPNICLGSILSIAALSPALQTLLECHLLSTSMNNTSLEDVYYGNESRASSVIGFNHEPPRHGWIASLLQMSRSLRADRAT